MKRILIVALYYPPCEQIGAKRPFKMANALSKSGWDVTVLTVDPKLTPPTGNLNAGDPRIKVIRTSAFIPIIALQNRMARSRVSDGQKLNGPNDFKSSRLALKQKFRNLLRKLAQKAFYSTNHVDDWSGWRRSALAAIEKSGAKYEVVLGTVPPFSTARLGMEIAKLCKCRFVLDYRDPWSEIFLTKGLKNKYSERERRRHIMIEDECLRATDLVFTVSPEITKMIAKRTKNKVLTFPQGFTGKVVENPFGKDSKYLLYAGSLAYGRDLSTILLALKTYFEQQGTKLKLLYFGKHSEVAFKQASLIEASEFLDIRGSVEEGAVLDFARGALCNLVIISEGYEYAYPGKLFDLIPAGRPIYVISSVESAAGILVERYRLGHSIIEQSDADFVRWLKYEQNREFKVADKVRDLNADNVYKKMIREGLEDLVSL